MNSSPDLAKELCHGKILSVNSQFFAHNLIFTGLRPVYLLFLKWRLLYQYQYRT